jgi:2-isopropylmalate synthase
LTAPQLSPFNDPLERAADGAVTVRLRELTLRQLGHMEADLTLSEKVHFLAELARSGVAETIVWGADADAEELVRRVKDAGIDIGIGFYGKVFFPEEAIASLDKAQRCGADFLCLNGRGSTLALQESNWTPERMIATSVDIVGEAKQRDLTISLGLYGGTQGELGFIQEWAGAVARAGVDRIYCPDSLGVVSPQGMARIVRSLREIVSVPIEAHCHNDFGLAVANSIAAVDAGADFVEVAVNGMDPERCGIACLDELATALEKLYGVQTGIRLETLTRLSQLHQRLTNTRVADNKPIVGRRAFNYRVAPGAVEGSSRHDDFYSSPRVVPFDPRDVGNERVFMLGKYSGPNEVAKRLDELGVSVADDELGRVVELVRERGRAMARTVTDDELRYFAAVVAADRSAAVGAAAP